MKKLYILIIIYFTASLLSSALAQNNAYGKVLYRINCGGWLINSIDTSNVNWQADNMSNPFIDTLTMGNKTYGIFDSVGLHSSVPLSTPYMIFRIERDLGLMTNQLEYNFAIPEGQKVEVRLYFAENYLDAANERLMNINIENQLVLANFDIYAEAGTKKGIMKAFTATSDGNLDIDLVKVKQLPAIHGIEIIEVNGVTIAGIFTNNQPALTFSAFPNPFVEEIILELGSHTAESIQIFDGFGREIIAAYKQSGSTITIDMQNQPKGIYYVQARVANKKGALRLMKE